MAEDSGLCAVPIDCDWFVFDCGLNKAWDDHSVAAGLTWADGVKEAHGGDFKLLG